MLKPEHRSYLLAGGLFVAIQATIWLSWVPRFPDFAAYVDAAQRKDAFVEFLCPLIAESNNLVTQDRDAVVGAQRTFQQTGNIDEQLYELGEKYGLTLSVEPSVLIDRLLRRVSPLPDALVIAQAAIESGWGTSKLYTTSHNLFGRKCFYVPDCIQLADDGAKYRRFRSPAESIELYFHDLNTLMPYKRLRDLRAANISEAHRLAEGLTAYSTRGGAYVQQIRHVIKANNLAKACAPV